MKVGIRKLSVKKSISSRTTGRVNRAIKKSTTPLYGMKGTGIVKDPRRAIYNKAYNRVTVGYWDSLSGSANNSTTQGNKRDNLGTGAGTSRRLFGLTMMWLVILPTSLFSAIFWLGSLVFGGDGKILWGSMVWIAPALGICCHILIGKHDARIQNEIERQAQNERMAEDEADTFQ